MPVFLDQIVGSTRREVFETKRTADLRDLGQRAEQHVPRGFRRSLEEKSKAGVAGIAGLKKGLPSEELAKELETAGAAALSVLTNEEFFQGSLGNLRMASAAVKIPCLRKDFIVDEFQLLEARANSADAVLLIVAALTNSELNRLALGAGSHGLDGFCGGADEDGLQRALDAGCDLVGVNTRNLRTFEVDAETAFRLAKRLPKSVVKVAESGIGSGEHIARLRAAGYQAFLIGESLMRAERPGAALRGLVSSTQYPVPSGR